MFVACRRHARLFVIWKRVETLRPFFAHLLMANQMTSAVTRMARRVAASPRALHAARTGPLYVRRLSFWDASV